MFNSRGRYDFGEKRYSFTLAGFLFWEYDSNYGFDHCAVSHHNLGK